MRRSLLSTGLAACIALFTACGGSPSPAFNAFTPAASGSASSPAPAIGEVSGGSGTSSTGSTSGAGPSGADSTHSTSALPTPPSNATVYHKLHDSTEDWSSCSECAGGSSTAGDYWSAPFQTSPSLSGSSRQFHVSGRAWSSVLWYKQLGAHDSASHFLWDFWVYFDKASAAQTWAAEYDLWQSLDGREFMIGSQCDFGDGTWDLWDSENGKWIKDSGVPCPRFSAEKWHHIKWYVERVSSTQYKYVTLVVDDKPYAINRTFTANRTSWGSNFGVQWQLDENSTGTTLNEWIDKVTVTMW